ncbi:MAG: tetratricopeptide repeat protein [Alphaproteobacteria bacterium]|nr:tetratricopeptide repeat protein [Alphaproteobacteria bacterium]
MTWARRLLLVPARALAWSEARDRSDYAILASVLFMALSAYRAWYVLPSPYDTTIGLDGLLSIVETEFPAATVLRVGIGAFGAVILLLLLAKAQALAKLRWPGWLLLGATLALPFAMQLWSPNLVRETQVIYSHVDRASNDIEFNLKNQQRDWRDLQRFDPSPVLRWATDLSGYTDWSFEMLGLAGQVDVLDALGLTNGYFNVAGRGWYFGMSGLLVFQLGVYGRLTGGRRYLLRDLPLIPVCLVSVFALILVPRAIGEYHSQVAGRAISKGDDTHALEELRAVRFWIPSIAYSLAFQAEIGAITQRRGCMSCPETYLYRANNAVAVRDYQGAARALEKAAALAPEMPGMRYWLGQAYVESGIDIFNTGQYTAADRFFRRALAYVPSDALAWYGRAIVQLRLRDFAAAAEYTHQVVRLQNYLGFKKYPPHAQWLLARSWSAYRRGDFVEAHRYFSEYLTPELW